MESPSSCLSLSTSNAGATFSSLLMHQSNARSLPAPLVHRPFDFAAGVYEFGDDQARSWIFAGTQFGGSKPSSAARVRFTTVRRSSES
jgi:hypothetical protein